MGYGCVPETLIRRDKGTTRLQKSTFQDKGMRRKIPRDRKGWVLIPTIFRDKQTQISDEDTEAKGKGLRVKEGGIGG